MSNIAKTLFTVILVLTLLIAGVASYFILEANKEEGAAVIVSINGVTVAEYPLDKDGIFPINNGTNILVIESGTARVADASCPDELCVRTGKISKTGEKIVCLPNKVMVEVIGAGEDIFLN